MNPAELTARKFHDTYEKLAPQFGYETRGDTRVFDPKSANGKLMIAVCQELGMNAKQALDGLERFELEHGNEHHPAEMDRVEDGTWVRFADVETVISLMAVMQIGIEATDEMCDSVRYLLVGMEQPGQTYGGIIQHCQWAGMDISFWPDWITREANRNNHFNKSSRAALIWHVMAHAALFGYKEP